MLLFMAFALVLALPAVALADNVQNDIASTAGADSVVNATVGISSTVGYYIDATGGTCDAADGTKATLTPKKTSGPAGGSVSISPASQEFVSCGSLNKKSFDFTADTAGDYVIEVTATDTNGTYNPTPAKFKLHVSDPAAPPATNNAPTVQTAALDALGTEGDTLQASGAFQDQDNDSLSLSANSTVGNFTDNGNGTWNWSLSTNDDVALNTITVTANDGNGGTVTDSFDYKAVNANPQLSALSLSGNSGTACIGGNNVDLGFSFSDAGSADTHSGTINWGDGSTADTFTTSPVSKSHSYSPGTYTILVNVSDDNGGSDSESSSNGAVSFSYNMSTSLLAPVNLNGTSVFKYGSTIPLKIRVLDCNSTPVSGLSPAIKIQKMSASTPTELINEATSTSSADTTGFMRYSDGQYIYNLASKSLPDPEATYRAVVSEGSSTPNPMNSQNLGLKK
jgi:hypothetical protein